MLINCTEITQGFTTYRCIKINRAKCLGEASVEMGVNRAFNTLSTTDRTRDELCSLSIRLVIYHNTIIRRSTCSSFRFLSTWSLDLGDVIVVTQLVRTLVPVSSKLKQTESDDVSIIKRRVLILGQVDELGTVWVGDGHEVANFLARSCWRPIRVSQRHLRLRLVELLGCLALRSELRQPRVEIVVRIAVDLRQL